MSPSKTNFEKLALRVGEWAILRNLKGDDVEMIVEVIETLRTAEETLAETGFFARTVSQPATLKFSWTCGKEEYDPVAASDELQKRAQQVGCMIEEELFGPTPGNPKAKPSPDWFYLVRSNGGRVTMQSPFPLSMDEICRLAIQHFRRNGFLVGKMVEISLCDEQFVPTETVSVPSRDVHLKAGQPDEGRRNA